MRIAVIVLCFVLGGCGIYAKKGRGTNIGPTTTGVEADSPTKRL
jgi:hypothetical protein